MCEPNKMSPMITEQAKRVTIFYDADCSFCRWTIAWVLRWDKQQKIKVEPIQGSLGSRTLADLAPDVRLATWHSLDKAGQRLSGGAALPVLAQVLPGGSPLAYMWQSTCLYNEKRSSSELQKNIFDSV